MRWLIASRLMAVLVLPLACSDDGVPQEVTSDASTGSNGTTGSSADETAVTTDQTSVTTSGTADTNATTVADTTGPAGSSDGSDTDPGGTSSGDSGTGSSGSDSSSSGSSSDTTGGGPLNVGDECKDDSECMSLVCWDFNDYDMLCFGAACSGPCMNDDDCLDLLTDAGAPNPEQSTCGDDGRCTMVSTGFGSFACAAPSSTRVSGS